jgi:hypothetical protein
MRITAPRSGAGHAQRAGRSYYVYRSNLKFRQPPVPSPVVVIDTHNLLHLLARTRAATSHLALAQLLFQRRLFRRDILLICDGNPPPGVLTGWADYRAHHATQLARGLADNVTLRFTGPSEEADDAIERLLESSQHPKSLLVVSSDRRVQSAAKRAGAHTLPATTLAKELQARPKPTQERPAFAEAVPLSTLEVQYWLTHLAIDAHGNPTSPPKVEPPPTGRRRPVPRTAAPELNPTDLNPADLDMARWLQLHPPPDKSVAKARPTPKTRKGRSPRPNHH